MVLSCNEDHYYDRIWYLQWESTRNIDVACSLTMQFIYMGKAIGLTAYQSLVSPVTRSRG